jgi:hypothetical protein
MLRDRVWFAACQSSDAGDELADAGGVVRKSNEEPHQKVGLLDVADLQLHRHE